jgi:hypothetical protein
MSTSLYRPYAGVELGDSQGVGPVAASGPEAQSAGMTTEGEPIDARALDARFGQSGGLAA